MNPEIYALSLIDWQFFASLTFKSEKLTEAVRIKLFFALMRRQADHFGVHFGQTIWCLRTERGEATGRIHHHALIAGFPKHAPTTATCFSWMKIWEQLKGGDEEYRRAGGDFYETRKFGSHCDVMLSKSVFSVIEGRRAIGERRRRGQRQAE